MQFAGFRPKRMVNGSMSLPAVQYLVIAASQTIAEGSAYQIGGAEAGYAADAASDQVGGYVVGFVVDPGNLNLPVRSVADNANYVDGTYTFVTTGSTYAAASDNVTDKKIAAAYISADGVVASALMDDAIGTTTGSGTAGYFVPILAGNNATKLDESGTATTNSLDYLLVSGRSGVSAIDPSAPLTGDRRVMVRANTQTI